MRQLIRNLRSHVGWLWAGIFRGELKPNTRLKPEGLEVHLATRQELLNIALDPKWQMTTQFVEEATARGDVCVVGYLNGELVSYGWAGYGTTPHVGGISVTFAKGHRYNYKAFTAREYRGRHLRGSFGTLEPADAERQVTHSIAFINYRNKASQNAEMRNGGRLLGYAGYVRVGRFFLSYATAGPRAYGFKFITGKGS